MALAIKKPPLDVPFRRGKAQKKPDYLSAIHRLPCVISGQYGVEAAHISFAAPEWGHYGRGKGTKAHDRWVLPLRPEHHAAQHRMNEICFWAAHYIDPHRLAVVIYGLWCEHGEDFVPFAEAFIRSNQMRNNR